MTLYLAQVDRHRHPKPKLNLLMAKRDDGAWLCIPPQLVPLPPDNQSVGESLVFMQIDKGVATKIRPALPTLLRMLQDATVKATEIEQWRETMTICSEVHTLRTQQHDEFLSTIKLDASLQRVWDNLRQRESDKLKALGL